MPVEVTSISLGAPPERTFLRGKTKREVTGVHEVILPGWDDIIHVKPTALLSKSERDERRGRMRRSLEHSPSPQVVRDFSRIGMEVDNVQDALVTLSVAGRVVNKVAGRVIPGFGWINSLADAVNILNVFYPKTAAKAVTGGVSRAGQRLSGRKKYQGSKGLKRELGAATRQGLSTYMRRAAETAKTGKVGFGFGEALQIFQTSDQLVGFGVSLGPIFGALQDSVYGFLRGARFDISGPLGLTGEKYSPEALEAMRKHAPGEWDVMRRVKPDVRHRVVIDWPGVFPLIDDIYGRPRGSFERDVEVTLDPLRGPAEKAVAVALNGILAVKKATTSAASAVWRAGKWIAGLRGVLSWEDHIELLCAQWLALNEWEPYLQQVEWGEIASRLIQNPLPDDDRSSTGLLGGRNLGEVSQRWVFGPGRAPFDWVDEAPTAESRAFSVALIESFAEKLLLSLEGPDARIEEQSSDAFRAVRLLHDYNLLPPYERTDEEVMVFLDRVACALGERGERLPTYSAVAEMWRSSFPGGDLSE